MVFVTGVSQTDVFNGSKKDLLSSLARDVVRQHAHHWCSLIKNEMAKFQKSHITTYFDTELFGIAIRTSISRRSDTNSQSDTYVPLHSKQVLKDNPPETVMSLRKVLH